MNDRLKFRAWEKTNEMMFVGIEKGVDFDDGSHYCFRDFLLKRAGDAHDWVLMQSTGLKDKTGKLIYEGDILHHEWEHKGKSGQYDYKVIWSKSMASFMKIYIGGEFDKHLAGGFCFLDIEGNGKDCEDLEIIGNIYEKPELLTKELQVTPQTQKKMDAIGETLDSLEDVNPNT